ncbi:MAG: hypothetical protein H0T53_00625 [Herpetosiphonaceae bacterium]|nr:hypothetical protein [Herpetosiphonaceae bacterium]
MNRFTSNRFFAVIILMFVILGCGRSEEPSAQTLGESSPRLETTSYEMGKPIPGHPVYSPPIVDNQMIIDLSRHEARPELELALTQTVVFRNPPPQTDPRGWFLQVDPSYFLEQLGTREIVHEANFQVYPLDGWVFKPQQRGRTMVGITNKLQHPIPTKCQNPMEFPCSEGLVYGDYEFLIK